MNTLAAPRPAAEQQSEAIETAEQAALVAEAFEAWNQWRSTDHTEAVVMSLPERQALAAESAHAALLCQHAAEMATDPQRVKEMHDAQRQLRLNTLFLVPEAATEANIDKALDLSVELAGERHQEWSLHEFDKDVKLFDLQHLIAYWEARQASETDDDPDKRASLQGVSQAILGATIIESVATIERAQQALEAIDVETDPNLAGKKRQIEGHIAEFLLLTACRLNLAFEGKTDRLILRSAIGIEDSFNTASRELSTDLIVHNPQEGTARFIQSKTGSNKLGRKYADHITKVFVNWEEFASDPEWVCFLLQHFVESKNSAVQQDLINELNGRLGLDKQPKSLGAGPQTSLQELITT